MSLKTRAILVVVIGVVMGFSLSLGGDLMNMQEEPEREQLAWEQARLFAEVMERVKSDYVEPIDDADEARWRYQRQRGEPVKRERLLVPEHPQHPPLLLGKTEFIENLTKPWHNRIERTVQDHRERVAELFDRHILFISLIQQLFIS